MANMKTDHCDDCGRESRVTRRWYTHYRTGHRVYPVRANVISFCVEDDCPSNRKGDKRAA